MQTAGTLQAFAVTCVSHRLIVLIFRSRAPYQWQPVQLGARASLRQTDRFRVLGRLGGPLRVQSWLPAERIQRHPLPGHARCPCTVERKRTKLYRYAFQREMHNKGPCHMLLQQKPNNGNVDSGCFFHQTHCMYILLLLLLSSLNYPKHGFKIPTYLLAV